MVAIGREEAGPGDCQEGLAHVVVVREDGDRLERSFDSRGEHGAVRVGSTERAPLTVAIPDDDAVALDCHREHLCPKVLPGYRNAGLMVLRQPESANCAHPAQTSPHRPISLLKGTVATTIPSRSPEGSRESALLTWRCIVHPVNVRALSQP